MKQLWVKVDPWDKKLVTAALEAGRTRSGCPEGRVQEVKALGLIRVVAPDGDLVPGKDFQEVTITGMGQEEESSGWPARGRWWCAPRTGPSSPWKTWWPRAATSGWKSAIRTQARTFLGVLERGVDGLVVTSR